MYTEYTKKTGKTIWQKTKKIFCLRRVNKKVIELCGNCFQQIILGHWLLHYFAKEGFALKSVQVSSLKFKSKCCKSQTSFRTNLLLSVDQIEPDWLAPEPFPLK